MFVFGLLHVVAMGVVVQGQWITHRPVVNCGDPPDIENGYVSWTRTTATYSCSPGYDLSGTMTVRCQADAKWEAAPQCIYTTGSTTPLLPTSSASPPPSTTSPATTTTSPPPTTTLHSNYVSYDNKYCDFNAIKARYDVSLAECLVFCDDEPRCVAAMYYPGSASCYLSNSNCDLDELIYCDICTLYHKKDTTGSTTPFLPTQSASPPPSTTFPPPSTTSPPPSTTSPPPSTTSPPPSTTSPPPSTTSPPPSTTSPPPSTTSQPPSTTSPPPSSTSLPACNATILVAVTDNYDQHDNIYLELYFGSDRVLHSGGWAVNPEYRIPYKSKEVQLGSGDYTLRINFEYTATSERPTVFRFIEIPVWTDEIYCGQHHFIRVYINRGAYNVYFNTIPDGGL